jgi:hypothetical protein
MLSSLIFTRSSTLPIAHIAPAVVAAFVAAQASIAATFPSHLGSERAATSLPPWLWPLKAICRLRSMLASLQPPMF